MRNRFHLGFTIVEIVVAVVVLSILVGLVMFSFNAAIDNARSSTLKADLAKSASNLKKSYVDSGSYPLNQAQAEEYIEGSDGVGFQYTYFTGSSYCLSGTLEDLVYHIDSSKTEAIEGGCVPGSTGGVTNLNLPVISTVNVTGTQAAVSWASVTGATGYDVRSRIQYTGTWATKDVAGSSSTTVTGLTRGNFYQFQVRAKNSSAQSDWSSSIQRAVLPLPSVTSSTTPPACSGGTIPISGYPVTVVWSAATNTSMTVSYLVEVSPVVTLHTASTVTNPGTGSLTLNATVNRVTGVTGPSSLGRIDIYGVGPNGELSTANSWRGDIC